MLCFTNKLVPCLSLVASSNMERQLCQFGGCGERRKTFDYGTEFPSMSAVAVMILIAVKNGPGSAPVLFIEKMAEKGCGTGFPFPRLLMS